MRKIDYIVIHCTAGIAQQKTEDIIRYWQRVLGWKSYGYHYLVNADGVVEKITDLEKPSNGVKGYNHNSIHIAYKGGWNGQDTRTDSQKESIVNIIRNLKKRYPHAKIVGHRDLSPDLNKDGKITPNEWVKICPCFDAMGEYQHI